MALSPLEESFESMLANTSNTQLEQQQAVEEQVQQQLDALPPEAQDEVIKTLTPEKMAKRDQALTILREEMDVAAFSASAKYKMGGAEQIYQDIVNDAQKQTGQRVITNELAKTYFGMLQPNEEIIGRLPGNFKPTTAVIPKNVKIIRDRENDELVFVKTGVETPANLTPPNAAAIADQLIKQGKEARNVFNVKDELEKLRKLSGDDLSRSAESALLTMNTEAINRRKLLESQANLQSGLNDAQKALDERLRLSTRYPTERSKRLLQESQQTLQRALITRDKLLDGLVKADPYMNELTLGSQLIQKTEMKRAAEEERRAAMKTGKREQQEARQEAIADNVTDLELQNARYLDPTLNTGDAPDKIREQKVRIHNLRNKNPQYKALLNMDTFNVYEALTHPDAKIRQGAFKILVGHDKQRYPDLRNIPDPQSTPLAERLQLRKYIENPLELAKSPYIQDGELRKELAKYVQLGAQGKGKEVDERRSVVLMSALRAHVNGVTENVLQDTTTWRSPEVTENTALAKVIKQVSLTRPKKDAPFGVVSDLFISSNVTDASGKVLTFDEKRAILLKAANDTVDGEGDNFLQPDLTGMKARLLTKVKANADLSHIRNRAKSINAHSPMQWLQMQREQNVTAAGKGADFIDER